MKSYLKSLMLTGVLALGFTSCQMNETVYSSISTGNFYKTAGDAEAALTAVYSAVADIYSTAEHEIADLSADQIYPRAVVGRNTLTLFSYDPNFSALKSFGRGYESPVAVWQAAYGGIEKANWVLERLPDVTMDETRKGAILGEAYFLRAFFHWTLTKNFGDVIVKTKASTSISEGVVGKSPKADVYKQIYLDLDEAINRLPSYNAATTVKGRTSKEVAMALYAKAALYNEDWATALQKANDVISSNKYSLMPSILDVFNVSKEDLARQENIWAFEGESSVPNRACQIPSLYGPKNSDGPAYGKASYGSAFAYQAFFDSFDPDDDRRLLLDTTYINLTGAIVHQKNVTPITTHGVLVKKFMDPNSNGGNYAINLPIFRLADIYLIAAEAEARANGPTTTAYGFINTIRNRAGLPDLTTGLDATSFIDAVIQERSWELFAEADRWYDLTRTDKFLTVIPNAVNDVYPVRRALPKHKYFPIPQDELNANPNLEQNDAWK
jgi:hypothetical protein